jgi:hypothetical protein
MIREAHDAAARLDTAVRAQLATVNERLGAKGQAPIVWK